jgi:hypothetical protein
MGKGKQFGGGRAVEATARLKMRRARRTSEGGHPLAAEKCMAGKRKLVVVDGETGETTPVEFKAKRRVPLPMTPRKALREAASVYAAVRRGEIPSEIGTKLCYMLKTTTDIHDTAEMQPMLAEIKEQIARLEVLAAQRR